MFNLNPKTLSGRRWAAITFSSLLIALVGTMLFSIVDPAHSQGRSRTHQHSSTLSSSTSARRMPPILVDPKIWGEKMAQQKRHHKLGDSKGRYLPARFIKRLDRYKAKHPKRTIDPWWRGPLHTGECFFDYSGILFPGSLIADTAFCMKYGDDPTISKIDKEVFKVKVVCGSGAIAGALIGANAGPPGVVIGAVGGGALTCGFQGIASWLIDLGGDRAHPHHHHHLHYLTGAS